MPPTTLIALDLGTSGAKAVRYGDGLEVLGRGFGSYAARSRVPGSSELDAGDVFTGVCAALRALPPGPADALVFSSQLYSAMATAADGRALTPALTWADVSAAEQARALRASGLGRALHARCGCPPAAIYPVAKWRHWSDAGWPTGTARVVGVKESVVFQLSGSWVVDESSASATGAAGLFTRHWDGEALDWAGVPENWLPEIVPVRHRFPLSASGAAATGLPSGLPVIVGGGDGPLASLGIGAAAPGLAAVNVGTSAAVRAGIPAPATDPDGGLWTYVVDGDVCVAGGIVVGAGSLLDSLRAFCGGLGPDVLDPLAASALDTPRCRIRSAGPHAPDWDESPRFDLEGLRPGHGPGEVARAMIGGIADALADLLRLIESRFGPVGSVRIGGSVGKSAIWDPAARAAFGRPLEPATQDDPSLRGAALVGLAALGVIRDPRAP